MTRGQVYAGKAVILIDALDRTDKTLATVEAKFKRLGNSLGAMGRTTFGAGFFGAIGSTALLARFAKYDDLILELRTKMGMLVRTTSVQEMAFERLEKRIRALGKSTSFTTQEVTQGAIRLAQAGFSGKEIEDTLQSVLDLARGTSTDLSNAATVLANAIRTYNLSTEQANEITSQFVRATRMGTIEIDDMAESLKYASATATTLGQSLPEVLAMFTLLSDKGMRGSISGTSFNTALGQIAKKADDIKAQFGFDVPIDSNGNVMFTDFLKNMSRATAEMNKLEKTAAFQSLFNLRGARSILPIANERDIARLLSLIDAISSASDEARQAAIVMDSGLGGAFRRAVSAVDDLIISLGKLQSGPLQSILNTIPSITNVLDELMGRYQGFTLLLAASPAIALAAGASMVGLSIALKQAAAAISGIRKLGGGAGALVKGSLGAKGISQLSNLKMPALMAGLGKYPTGAASPIKTQTPQFMQRMVAANKGVAMTQGTVQIGKYVGQPGIQTLMREEALLGDKLQKAAKAGNAAQAAKYGAARKKAQQNLAQAIKGPKNLPFLPMAGLQGATAARSAGGMQSAFAGMKAGSKAPILPQVMSGLGKAGGMAKNLGTLAAGFAKVTMAVSKFVFSLNGVLLLFTFGDRIPIIKDVLANLGSAFGAAFGQIGGIMKSLAPVFSYFMESFGLLGNKDTASLGFAGLVDSLSLMGSVIQGKLLAAWGAFKAELGFVWDTGKMLLGTMWELLKVITTIATNSIGNILGNTLDRLEMGLSNLMNIFSGEGSGNLFKDILVGGANLIASLFDWVGFAVIKLNNMFYSIIEAFESMLLRVLSHIPGVDTRLAEATVGRNRAARQLREEQDLQGNEKAMQAFRQNMDQLFSSDAFTEGSAQMQAGLQRAAAAVAQAMQGRMNLRNGMMAGAGAGMAGVPTASNPVMQQQQQMQEVRQALRGFAAALVGSGTGTRGNVTRAVTESELKKHTQILGDMLDELKLGNERSGLVFRK